MYYTFMRCNQSYIPYDDTYQKITNANIGIGLMPVEQSHVMYIYENSSWLFIMNDDFDVESLSRAETNQTVYGKDAVGSSEYDNFVKDSGLSQNELNEFAKLYYQNNIESVMSKTKGDH